jgi:hypothetical protein
VQTARNFVCGVVELAAGVLREYDFGGGFAFLRLISVGIPRPLSITVMEFSM